VHLFVPSGTLHVHPIDEAAIRRRLVDGGWSCVIAHLEVKGKLIDSDLVLASEVLQRACEEGLWEEESRDPEGVWSSAVDPLGQEVDSLVQIIDPRGQWFQGEETNDGLPGDRHLVIVQRVSHRVKLLRHDNLSDESLLQLNEHLLHDDKELVIADQLLRQHSVHRFIVVSRVLLLNSLDVEGRRCLLLDLCGNLTDRLLTSLATGVSLARLDRQDILENDTRVALISRDLGVLMKAESLGCRVQRQRLNVFKVILNRAGRDRLVETRRRQCVVIFQDLWVDEAA